MQSASDAQQIVEIAKNSGISISLEELKELENQELETGMKGFLVSSEQCGFKQEEGALAHLFPVT